MPAIKRLYLLASLFGFALMMPGLVSAQNATMTYPINKNVNWHNSLVPATSVTETYNYQTTSDTLTITFTFNQSGLAALPPMFALAKDYGFPITCSGIQDTGFKSIFGPLQGINNTNTLTCTVTGLKKYTATKTLGSGTVPASILTDINTQVDKIIAAGHFKPELLGPSMPGSAPIDAKGFLLWYSPGDVHYFLSEVYPLLDTTRQTAIRNFLTSERTTYKPEIIKGLPFWKNGNFEGANRNPSNTTSQVYGYWWSGEPELGNTTWIAQAYFKLSGSATIPNLYGLSRYYQTLNLTPTTPDITNFTTIVQNQYTNTDWATLYWKSGSWPEFSAVSAVNQLFAGMVGHTRMAEKTGSTQAVNLGYGLLSRLAALRVAMGKYQQYQIARGAVSMSNHPLSATQRNADNEAGFANFGDLFTYNFDAAIKDIRQISILDNTRVEVSNLSGTGAGVWESGGGNNNSGQAKSTNPQEYPLGWNSTKGPQLLAFADITPELGRLLKDYLPQEVAQNTAIYAETQPIWYAAYGDQILGIESNFPNPMDAWGQFMARAWVNQEPANQLEQYIDQPWFDQGDYFYLHKLAETAKAYTGWSWSGDTPIPTPNPRSRFDLDNNQVIDYRDLLLFLPSFTNIFDFNGIIKYFGQSF